jgi:hypothetical protein
MMTIEGVDVLAREAIGMSIRENRIVRIVDEDGSQSIVLDEESEDGVRNGDEHEYWGTRASDRGEWRVHVVTSGVQS